MRITFYQLKPKGHPFPLFSWLIRLFQKTNYSHTAIGYFDMIADVPFTGFRRVKSNEFFKGYHIVGHKTREFDFNQKVFEDWLRTHSGKKYDYKQFLGLSLKMLGLKKFNSIGSDFDNLVCNELIVSFLVQFDKLIILDSDNWDLNMTWERI